MGSGDGNPAGQRTAAGPGFLRRRWAVVLTCALVAPAAALEATLAEDRTYSASARIAPRAEVDLPAVERATARHVGWRSGDVAEATDVRPAGGDAVEAVATTRDERLAPPLANALAREYSSASRGRARIIAQARVASEDAEPQVARNVALGLGGGLLLGLALALLLDVAGRRRGPAPAGEHEATDDLLEEILGEDGAYAEHDERGDREMARFVALNMVLDGAGRDEVRRHIDEHFDVDRKEELVEEAYRRAEG